MATTTRTVLAQFSASHPRGSWPAEEHAARLTREGTPATVVMDFPADAFLVVSDESKQVA